MLKYAKLDFEPKNYVKEQQKMLPLLEDKIIPTLVFNTHLHIRVIVGISSSICKAISL